MLWLAALLGAAFVALHAVPSSAHTVCGEHAKFVDMLGVTYAEKAVAIGLTSTGAVIGVLTSPTGTWPIILTYPTGFRRYCTEPNSLRTPRERRSCPQG